MDLKPKQWLEFGALAMSIAIGIATSSANAATLNIVDGQLLGASGVIVDGASYDVAFLEGSCIDLYNGCGPSTEFTFTTYGEAVLASQALIDQVFLDSADLGLFDSDPSLTNGCAETNLCGVLTPYGVGTIGIPTIRFPVVATVHSINIGTEDPYFDAVFTPPFDVPQYTSQGASSIRFLCTLPGCDTGVFAVWTPVPEPGTAILMGLGLLGLAAQYPRPPRLRIE